MKKFASVFAVLSLVSVLAVPVSTFASPVVFPPGNVNQSVIVSLQAQIAALLAQIQQLQSQLAQQQSQPAQFCYTFNTNLRIGDRGRGVDALAKALEKEGFVLPDYAASGIDGSIDFGEFVASAVTEFQEKYRSEILTPNGLRRGTGFVGPATRAKLNALYGCGVVQPPVRTGAPVITGLDAPTTLAVGQQGTWTVRAYDPENGNLSYSVVWGDEVHATQGFSATPAPAVVQSATFTHVYNQAGTYTPTFLVTDNTGLSARTSASVRVGGGGTNVSEQVKCVFNGATTSQECGASDTTRGGIRFGCSGVGSCVANVEGIAGTQLEWKSSCGGYAYTTIDGQTEWANFSCGVTTQPITVWSPNGGERWVKGTQQTIKWQDNTTNPPCPVGMVCTQNEPRLYDIKLAPYYPPCVVGSPCVIPPYGAPYTIAIGIDRSSYNWRVGDVLQPTTPYGAPSPTISLADGPYTIQVCQSGTNTCDSSDSHFRITSGTATVSELYKCVFNGSNTTQSCRTADAMAVGCSGIGTCGGEITGVPGTQITWKSTCGGYAYTTIDGQNEHANFSCYSTQPSITVNSPNGGESWQKRTVQAISWTLPPSDTTEIRLLAYIDPDCESGLKQCDSRTPITYIITKYVSPIITNGRLAYEWSVGEVLDTGSLTGIQRYFVPDGLYKVQACYWNQSGKDCDSSNSYFKIYSGTTQPSITVVSPSGGETYNVGGSIPVTWKSANLPVVPLSISLRNQSTGQVYVVASGILNDGNETVPTTYLPSLSPVPVGAYFLQIKTQYQGIYVNGASDSYFKIVSGNLLPPTALFTIEGQDSYTYNVGQINHFKWDSSNANIFSSFSTANNPTKCGQGTWVANTARGESRTYLGPDWAGCIWHVTYTAKNTITGQSASKTVKVSVNPLTTSTTTSTVQSTDLNQMASVLDSIQALINQIKAALGTQ